MDRAIKELVEANARLHRQLVILRSALLKLDTQIDNLVIEDYDICWENGDPKITIEWALQETEALNNLPAEKL